MADRNDTRAALSDLLSGPGGAEPGGIVKRALRAIRSHLGMEIAYVSEFVDGRSVFREVDAPGLEALIKVGDSHSLDDVYCLHILEGRLPALIPDTAAEPIAAAMPITHAAPIGKHISVPIRLPDGRPYGMFCCLGPTADPSLRERDLQVMKAFAEIAAFEINREVTERTVQEEKRARIEALIASARLSIAYQPILRIDSGEIVAFECLSRFTADPPRSPDQWFAEATQVGLGVELELTAVRMALSAIDAFPHPVYLTVNVSPETLLAGELSCALASLPAERIVLEVTEHTQVRDYGAIVEALKPLRRGGIRVAVDDAGAGYASLQHILHLQPDLIKLDMALTRNIALDPARRALASALITFAQDTGSRIIAEGVETSAELSTLRKLGVEKAQGYFLGKPMPLAEALQAARAKFRRPAAQVA